MKQTKLFCDTCGKECDPKSGASQFVGVLARLDIKLEKQIYQFAQDYCSACSEVILNFISELKKDIKK